MEYEKHGYAEHIGDTLLAGIVARDVYTHWDDDVWRNAFIMAVGDYCENQVIAHQDELNKWIKIAQEKAVAKARQSVVKAYLVSKAAQTKVDPYTRRDGTHVGGYKRTYRPARSPQQEIPRGQSMHPQDYNREQSAAMTAAMVEAYNRKVDPKHHGLQTVAYYIEDPMGNLRVETPDPGSTPSLKDGEFVRRQQALGFQNPANSGQHAVNLAQALGANHEKAGSAGAVVQGVSDIGKEHNWFQRLSSMSNVLHHATGGSGGPVPVQVATAMGAAVGQHGPEVSRVLGPSIRRYSYKYRGMTASPAQFNSTARSGLQEGEGGPRQFEARLLHTLASTDKSTGGLGAVPTDAQNALLLQSGSTAPSQGFLLDAKGKVTQQAVGHADDHYVPFNLAQLHTLKNGSYVRSRAYGGPTTEDVSLAMRSGARRISTISRHGVYTIEFDPRANTKRYGYTPRQVVHRYGRLLDAIESGKVKDPNNADQILKLDARGYEVALQSLKAQYPLLIAEVRHEGAGQIPALEGRRAGSGERDTGYVRPMYLKPSDAKAGYHDALLNPGGSKSYDELEGYRSLKATRLKMEKARAEEIRRQEQQPRSVAVQQHYRTGGVVPIGVAQRNPGEANRAEAAGTDTGAVVRSYDYRRDPWSAEHHAEMLGHAEALIRHHLARSQETGERPDEFAVEWYNIFKGARNGDPDMIEKLEKVRTGEGGHREDLIDGLNTLDLDESADGDSGLITHWQGFQDGLIESGDDEGYVREVDQHGVESVASVQADPDWAEAEKHRIFTIWKKDPNLGEAKRKQVHEWFEEPAGENDLGYEETEPRGAYWDDPELDLEFAHEDDFGLALTPYQQMANRMARAKGQKPPFKPAEDAEPTAVEIDSGAREGMTEEELDEAARKYAEKQIRDLGGLDDDYS
jgi:hypothetical protein